MGVQALQEGVLLRPEITVGLKQQLRETIHTRVSAQRTRERFEKRKLVLTVGRRAPLRSELSKCVAWLDPSSTSGIDHESCRIALEANSQTSTTDVTKAFMMVVPKPGSLHNLRALQIHMVAMLKGGYCATPGVIMGHDHSACIKYQGVLGKKLIIYISQAWRHKHNKLAETIYRCCQNTTGCKWELIWRQDRFLETKRQSKFIKKAGALALVTQAEATLPVFNGIPRAHLLDTAKFMKKIRKVDAGRTCTGNE